MSWIRHIILGPMLNLRLSHLEHQINLAIQLEQVLMATVDDIQAKIADLMTKVEAEHDATQAIITYVSGMKSQMDDLTTQLKTALEGAVDPAKIQSIADQLDAVAAGLDADIVAEKALVNTDAATPADTTPVEETPVEGDENVG